MLDKKRVDSVQGNKRKLTLSVTENQSLFLLWRLFIRAVDIHDRLPRSRVTL